MATLKLYLLLVFVFIQVVWSCEASRWDSNIRMTTEKEADAGLDVGGTRWALLVAGSQGLGNYRHQVYYMRTS